ncbi:hypothetical protein GC207_01660 [bacterium]|nr:hypothetical protein [bacterium]
MKSIFTTIALAALFCLNQSAQLIAQEQSESNEKGADKLESVDQVRVEDGKLIATAKGKAFSPTNSVVMPFKIKVMTNLTFTVADGSPRKLKDGQILGKDGNLQSPDGSLVPVMDHITQNGGKVLICKDGVAKPVSGETTLGDGSKVFADGTYIDQSGHPTKLLDGQLIMLSGSKIPATDTATMKDGKVVVQKDGSLITLRPAQTMMMSDGTRVTGDGTVIGKDGKTTHLGEGELVKIEGVRRR